MQYEEFKKLRPMLKEGTTIKVTGKCYYRGRVEGAIGQVDWISFIGVGIQSSSSPKGSSDYLFSANSIESIEILSDKNSHFTGFLEKDVN